MTAFVASGQVAGATGGTDWAGGEGVGETSALCSEGIDVWRLDDRVSRTAEEVGALVVGEEEDNIRTIDGAMIPQVGPTQPPAD